jgi:shikimate kinase
MPASGKTTIGKALSLRLGVRFMDTDSMIEAKELCNIPELFNQKGEPYFRQLEKEVLAEFLQSDLPGVIATGGGLPAEFDNMYEIKKYSVSFYIDTGIETLINRVLNEPDKRPLLSNNSNEEPRNTILNLLRIRKPYYLQSDYPINGDRTLEEVVDEMINLIKIDHRLNLQ